MNSCAKLAIQPLFLLVPLAAALAWLILIPGGGTTHSAGGLTITMTDAPDPVAPGGFVTFLVIAGAPMASAAPGFRCRTPDQRGSVS